MGWGVFTLSLSLLRGVGVLGFHPHPNPLTPRRIYDPEGEGVCRLVFILDFALLPTLASPEGEGVD